MNLLFVPVLAVVLTQAGDDPAKTQKALEDRIAAAKSVQTMFSGKVVSPKGEFGIRGSVATAGDKARFEVTLEGMGKSMKVLAVSDGVKTVALEDGKRTEQKARPEEMRQVTTAALARSGVTATFLILVMAPRSATEKKETVLDMLQVSDFKQLKADKVSGRDAVVIEYKLRIRDGKELKPFTVTVWVDARLNLPIRREVRGEADGAFSVTENYDTFAIDPKLDPKLFELPK
jgi:outer membrane lipoprotein-sorting protein